jgi:hypothetical protein
MFILLSAVAALALACSGDSSPSPPAETPTLEATATPELPPNATGLPPTVTVPLGTTCKAHTPPLGSQQARPNGSYAAFGGDPFCIAWTDVFLDETGFRVELTYGQRVITYNVPPNVNEVFPPPQDWPLANGAGSLAYVVYALTPAGEVVVGNGLLQIN